jgi:hypothetical protein
MGFLATIRSAITFTSQVTMGWDTAIRGRIRGSRKFAIPCQAIFQPPAVRVHRARPDTPGAEGQD